MVSTMIHMCARCGGKFVACRVSATLVSSSMRGATPALSHTVPYTCTSRPMSEAMWAGLGQVALRI